MNTLKAVFADATIVQVKPGSGYAIDFKELKPRLFRLDKDTSTIEVLRTAHRTKHYRPTWRGNQCFHEKNAQADDNGIHILRYALMRRTGMQSRH